MKKSLRVLFLAALTLLCAATANAAEANTEGYKFSIKSSGATFAFEVLTPCEINGEDVTYGDIKLYKFTQAEETPLTEVKTSYVSALALTSGYKYHVTEIADEVFKGQTDIKKIAACTYVKKVGASAFEGCTALTGNLEFPSIEEIGDNAFKGCSASGLKIYFLTSKVPTVGTDAFTGLGSDAQIRFSLSLVKPEHVTAFSAYSDLLYVYFTFPVATEKIKILSCQVPVKLSNPESNLNIWYVKNATETADGVTVETEKLKTGEYNIPANTALIYQYHGTATTSAAYGRKILTSEPSVSYTNLLTANAKKVTLPASDSNTRYYVFTPADPADGSESADVTTFTKVTEDTEVAAGRGYLMLGTATGISEVNADKDNSAVYDLNGVRVKNPKKGVFIMGGKKVVLK